MEWKIGEIFEIASEWYQCVEDAEDTCVNCCFYNGGFKLCAAEDVACAKEYRSDAKSTCFKKLEKVGEPIIYMSRTFQRLKSSDAEQCKYCYFGNQVCNPQLCGKESFLVEIKQNKEDMEKYKMHDAKEDIPEFDKVVDECLFGQERPNLKPFNLEQAKAGKPVCTRDGRKARIICFDRNDLYPIVALIECEDGKEIIGAYSKEGQTEIYEIKGTNLMMLPEKKEGWVNVYRDNFGLNCSIIYDNKDIALSRIDKNEEDTVYIDTVKISWEE